MKEIKKLDVMSVAVVTCIIYAVIGLIIGLFGGLFIGMISSILPTGNSSTFGMGFGMVMVILYPLMLGFIGFVGGALGAFVYNLIAKRVGGIKLELADLDYKPENQ